VQNEGDFPNFNPPEKEVVEILPEGHVGANLAVVRMITGGSPWRMPHAEGQVIVPNPSEASVGQHQHLPPSEVEFGEEEEEGEEVYTPLASPSSPPQNIQEVPQFPEEVMDVDLTGIFIFASENVAPELAQTRRAVEKIKARLQTALAQQKLITEVLEQWFGKIRALAGFTEDLGKAVGMQGQGLLDLRRHTHEALMAQAEENSQKIQALSQELVTLEQSLKSAFTEIRNEVPKNLQERLGHWEMRTVQLENQFAAWKGTPIPAPALLPEVGQQIKGLFESLATVQGQVNLLAAQVERTQANVPLDWYQTISQIQEELRQMKGRIPTPDDVYHTVEEGVRDALGDYMRNVIVPMVDQKIAASRAPSSQSSSGVEEELRAQLSQLSRRLADLEASYSSPSPPSQGEEGERFRPPPKSLAETGGRLHLSPTSLMLHRTHPQVQWPSVSRGESRAKGCTKLANPDLDSQAGGSIGAQVPLNNLQGSLPNQEAVRESPWRKLNAPRLGSGVASLGDANQILSRPIHQPWRPAHEFSTLAVEGPEMDRESVLRSTIPEVAIHAVSQAASSILTPLVTEAMKNLPRFSGQREDFEDWRERWERALRVIVASNGQALPSAYAMELLYSKLDEASQKELNTRMKQDPTLAFHDYYAELCRTFAMDVKLMPRNKWRKITLDKTKGKVTLVQWRRFKINLEQALDQGERPGDVDLREHILQQLTSQLRDQVLREEHITRKRQCWVRITVPYGMDIADLMDKVREEMGPSFDPDSSPVVATQQGFMFDCKSERLRTRALSLNGLTHVSVPGMVRVEEVSPSLLSANSILELLDDIIHREDEIRLANPVETPPTVTKPEVEVRENPDSNRKRVGKGGKGAQQTQTYVEVVQKSGKGKGLGPERNPSPPKQGFGRGPPRWDGARARSLSPHLGRQAGGECWTCKRLGREFMHDFWSCPQWVQAHPYAPPGWRPRYSKALQPQASFPTQAATVQERICRTCLHAGRPANHSPQQCQRDWSHLRKGNQVSQGNPAPPKPLSPQKGEKKQQDKGAKKQSQEDASKQNKQGETRSK
jgi:hypothetical protein